MWQESPNLSLYNSNFEIFITGMVSKIFAFLGTDTARPDFEITTFICVSLLHNWRFFAFLTHAFTKPSIASTQSMPRDVFDSSLRGTKIFCSLNVYRRSWWNWNVGQRNGPICYVKIQKNQLWPRGQKNFRHCIKTKNENLKINFSESQTLTGGKCDRTDVIHFV